MPKVVPLKETSVPVGTEVRKGLADAIADRKRANAAKGLMAEQVAKAQAHVEACRSEVAKAEAAVAAAVETDATNAVEDVRSGRKIRPAGSIRAARITESECDDALKVALQACLKFENEAAKLSTDIAEITNAVYTERNKIIADAITRLIADGEGLRQRMHTGKTLLTVLLHAAAEAPQLEGVSGPMQITCRDEREAAIGDARKRVEHYMVAGINDADRGAAEVTSQKLRGELNRLLEDSAIEVSIEVK